MPYKVINRFKDKEGNNTLYNVGDQYPKGDYVPSEERVNNLMSVHPKYKCAFIEKIHEESLLTKADIKKLNKGPQEELILELGGNPEEAKNEDERVSLILELQDNKRKSNNEPSSND
ncbi:hypothetical protein FZW96_12035 [Bacillus sp. BGMRC 2118]|nr:hypothetical protein FZW96_12035 [Bacillus sp. BGMRC 2118]